MSVTIPAPQSSLPTVGLRASIGAGVVFNGIERYSTAIDRWWTPAGWNFETPPCSELQSGTICVNPRPFAPGNPGVQEGVALSFESQIQCSTWGTDIIASDGKVSIPKFEEYALEQFNRQAFAAISSEIWSGTESRASGYQNKYLALDDGNVTDLSPAGAVSIKDGIGLLDEYLACCNPQGNGLIHSPVKYLTYFGAEELMVDTGTSRRATHGGNTIVAECGYAGTGPGDFLTGPTPLDPAEPGKVWLYATGPMLIRIIVDESPLSHVDILNNDATTVLSGHYMFGWSCCHAAVQVEVCPL